jgi:triosephosphate isomerase
VRAGLQPIICVGETLKDRDAGRALQVVARQAAGSIPGALKAKAFAIA